MLIDTETCMPRACESRPLKSMDDVLRFIADVRATRTARSTRMNESKEGHEGSSRSHAALILNLVQAHPDSKCTQEMVWPFSMLKEKLSSMI